MMSNHVYGNIVTTIQNPTNALSALANMAESRNELLIIVGDKKTPPEFTINNAMYLCPEKQDSLGYQITQYLPWNSYTRKMLGYLKAAKLGCSFIRETDDDNFPLDNFFLPFPKELIARLPKLDAKWINPYVYFSSEYIWPRGFPIELIDFDRTNYGNIRNETSLVNLSRIGVVQGLANGAPDVDALYRLIYSNSEEFQFQTNEPLVIPRTSFAPFNSQVTAWSLEILPLMYLPQTCTFRMTDIWRSYIATYLMHASDFEIIFAGPSAFQDRNVHNLLRDFEEEVPGYLRNAEFVEVIQSVDILGGTKNLGVDLQSVYKRLVSNHFFEKSELLALNAWLEDCYS